MVAEKLSESVNADDSEVEAIRRGSRERALGVAVITIALSSVVAWILVDAGYGVVSSLLIVWMFGNLLFLGLASLARALTRSRARRDDAPQLRGSLSTREDKRNPDIA
ncbi:hypothetical protein G5B40_01715 [Pikeienuella piscinae]|uniref:Uncharacterized protein n=1 Tax=Pikeienuella piscinae TaxID=2748098 RepID=A0A7L5BT04_9RHOB|nr:hypothetical protein [Pikeienuella piscinae]QIE54272.1 hypothetical protein G5B40_01715 [Pikeienuella piscinae]